MSIPNDLLVEDEEMTKVQGEGEKFTFSLDGCSVHSR